MQVTEEYYTLAPKQKNLPVTELKRTCVIEFFHSDESSSIDSNSRKILRINREDCVGWVWSIKIVEEQYRLFEQSDIIENYK